MNSLIIAARIVFAITIILFIVFITLEACGLPVPPSLPYGPIMAVICAASGIISLFEWKGLKWMH